MEHSFSVTTIFSWLSSKTQISSPDAIFLVSVAFIKQPAADVRTKYSPNS